jgi:probable HAF family extracellular repeat protein
MPSVRLPLATLVAGCLLVACGGTGSPSAPAEFIPVGLLPTFVASAALAVSADGRTVAGTMTDAGGRSEAFVWRPAHPLQLLGTLTGGTSSQPSGLSADGGVTVGSGNDAGSPSSAFRFSAETGMVAIPPVPGASLCSAKAVSDDGNTIVGTCLQAGNVAFRWTAASGSIPLGRFGTGTSGGSSALAVSRDGQVTGGQGHPFLTGAVLWDRNATPLVLGKQHPDDQSATVTALSQDGSIAVGTSVTATGVAQAFRWTAQGGMQLLAAPGTVSMHASAMSADGSVIVGRMQVPGDTAFVWDAQNGVRRLADVLATDHGTALPGWTLAAANAISADGSVIAGSGTDPQGRSQGWMVRLR